MSQATNTTDTTREQLKLLYAPIEEELAEVDRILKAELQSKYGFVDELVQYGFRLSGKKLRPALLLLTAKAVGNISEHHLTLAAVMEIIHTATLVHDDILDGADMRRHLQTVHSQWGVEASVLLGDYLFTHAFYLASTTGSTYACKAIGRATNITCEGEMRQIDDRANYEMTQQQYLSVIEGKTAELCACCCQLGAHFADDNEQVQNAMYRYGLNLGIAFQIVDDLLDVLGEEQTVGKSLGTDLEKEKATLPLIHFLEKATQNEKDEVIRLLHSGEDFRQDDLLAWFNKYDAVGYAREKAEYYAHAATAELQILGPSKSREMLEILTAVVVSRGQ